MPKRLNPTLSVGGSTRVIRMWMVQVVGVLGSHTILPRHTLLFPERTSRNRVQPL